MTGRASIMAAALLVVCSAARAPLAAQEAAAKTQPDVLNFGTVREGATVEGSVLVTVPGKDTAGAQFRVQAPEYVRVKQVALDTRREELHCAITFALHTARRGQYGGFLRVELKGRAAKIPVTAVVLAREAGLTRLLVVQTPIEMYSTDNAEVFDAWLDTIRRGKFDVHYLDVQRNHAVLGDLDIASFHVILLGERGLTGLQDEDTAKLTRFVEDGGRLIVAANSFYRRSVEKANPLIAPYGLEIGDEEAPGVRSFTVAAAGIATDPLTAEIEMLTFFRPSPVRVTDPKHGKVLVAAPPFPGAGFVAVGRKGKGEVVALGQSLWWKWISDGKAFGNPQLMSHLLTRPPAVAVPQDLEQLLKAGISYTFDRRSLQDAVHGLPDAVKDRYPLPFEFQIEIKGRDLIVEGITRNQQIRDFDQREKTVGEVLTALLLQANPVRNVTGPADANQKLVWVVEKNADDPTRSKILITTRRAAEQQQRYELPKIFRR